MADLVNTTSQQVCFVGQHPVLALAQKANFAKAKT
jgi:hypothetical protein